MQIQTTVITTLFQQARQVTTGVAVDAFLGIECCQRSPQTLQWYDQRLRRMCAQLGTERAVGDVMEGDLMAYYAGIGKVSAYTLHGHGRAIKRFWRWLYQRGILAADLSLCIRLPRLPRQGHKGISEENLRRILEAAEGNLRDIAMLRFIESTGCRRAGVADLQMDDLNLAQADPRLHTRATVREKGQKSRMVALSPEAVECLRRWLAVRPDCELEQVFVGYRHGLGWRPLTPAAISAIISRYKRRLGLRGACSPHQWRHRWARDRIQRGMSLGEASRLLGHENIKVTNDFYGQFDFETLQATAERYF